MTNERLTLEEMAQHFPDEWLLIVDCEFSENAEFSRDALLSTAKTVRIFTLSRETIAAAERRAIRAKCLKVWGTYCNGTHHF